ncbi:hypothetical protein NQZ68_009233 [Dissostichus eleginoides]|nr:hypothetical protein NQZ68_009233 [Dissostichus eleginoides]
MPPDNLQSLSVVVKDQRSDVQWQPDPPPHTSPVGRQIAFSSITCAGPMAPARRAQFSAAPNSVISAGKEGRSPIKTRPDFNSPTAQRAEHRACSSFTEELISQPSTTVSTGQN